MQDEVPQHNIKMYRRVDMAKSVFQQQGKRNWDSSNGRYVPNAEWRRSVHRLRMKFAMLPAIGWSLFVTAAHVVQEHDFRLWVDGKEVRLKKDDAILFKYKQAEDGADIAVFRLEGFNSPLEFDTSTPQTDMLLDSISYEHIVEGSLNTDNIFLDESRDCYKLIECKATIEALAGNYFNARLQLFWNQEVVVALCFIRGKCLAFFMAGN